MAALAVLAALLPARASAAEIEKHELPSGRSYVSYRPRGLPEKPLLVLYLSHKHRSAEAAAQAWKERYSSIKVMAIFPEQDKKGWRAYDWDCQKIVKDRELAYLDECVAHAEKDREIEKRHTIVAGDESGGDYAFELALRSPERFTGAVSIVPSWCATNKYEANANKVRLYFLVGEKDDRKKQAQDAYDRLKKKSNDMIWRPVEGLGHDLPPVEEVERAIRWHEELAGDPTEESLAWATREWESGCMPLGIHLLGKLSRDKGVGERAKKLLQSIEKQAQKELDDARKQPKYAQIEELERLHDRYGPLPALYDAINKALADAGAVPGRAEPPPPPAESGSDDETAKILEVAQRAQSEKRSRDYPKALDSLKEMLSLIDKADLGAREKKQLEIVARYELARTYSLSGKKSSAIDELTKTVDLGYRDWRQIESDKELDPLRGEGEFQNLLNKKNK